MTRTLTPTRATVIIGCAAAMMLAGCGQDETGSSSRGADTETDGTSVENAFIVPNAAPESCAIQVGDTADINFTVTNNRHNEPERLMRISTEVADAVQIVPGPGLPIPAGASIAAGQPIEQPASPAPDQPFTVTMQSVSEAIEPGMTVPVTFEFEKFGELTMDVPVEACPTQAG